MHSEIDGLGCLVLFFFTDQDVLTNVAVEISLLDTPVLSTVPLSRVIPSDISQSTDIALPGRSGVEIMHIVTRLLSEESVHSIDVYRAVTLVHVAHILREKKSGHKQCPNWQVVGNCGVSLWTELKIEPSNACLSTIFSEV